MSAKNVTTAGIYFAGAACALQLIAESLGKQDKVRKWVGGLFVLAGSCDFVDGALARLKQTVTLQSALDDLSADRKQELIISVTKSIRAIYKENILNLAAALISGFAGPFPSYFRAKDEELGYHPSESSKNPLGTRPGRFAIGAVTTTFPDLRVGALQVQPILDGVSALSNIQSARERARLLDKIKKQKIVQQANESLMQQGKMKADYLKRFIVLNTLVLGSIGLYGLLKKAKK